MRSRTAARDSSASLSVVTVIVSKPMRGLNQFISESIFDADFDALDNELNKDWLEKNNRGSIKKVTYSPNGIEGEGHLIL